jgi:hypothetical protein
MISCGHAGQSIGLSDWGCMRSPLLDLILICFSPVLFSFFFRFNLFLSPGTLAFRNDAMRRDQGTASPCRAARTDSLYIYTTPTFREDDGGGWLVEVHRSRLNVERSG